ncbi:MAG: preprotein translocase subunit SecB [Rhodospirillales bacterium]|jgi:preprotein translocase subunit SecB|nr:preprotein translocase subunit SecB [Rhodospirillales bacterium]
MSEEQAAGGEAKGEGKPGSGAAGRAPGQAPITVLAQYLKDLSFENPGAPVVAAGGQAPQGRVDVDVKARSLGEHGYEVSLVMRAEASREGTTAFLVEVEYAGVFQLNGVPAEAVEPVLLIECPRILFPYARAIVSGATQDGGYAPLLVNPIDFAQLYRAQRMRQSPTATA